MKFCMNVFWKVGNWLSQKKYPSWPPFPKFLSKSLFFSIGLGSKIGNLKEKFSQIFFLMNTFKCFQRVYISNLKSFEWFFQILLRFFIFQARRASIVQGEAFLFTNIVKSEAAAKVAALQLVYLIIFRSLCVSESVTLNVGPLLNVGKWFKLAGFGERKEVSKENKRKKKDVK